MHVQCQWQPSPLALQALFSLRACWDLLKGR